MSDGLQGWVPDPVGHHEMRWFSQGQPTALVRDGRSESRDPMPATPGSAVDPDHAQPIDGTSGSDEGVVDNAEPEEPSVNGELPPSACNHLRRLISLQKYHEIVAFAEGPWKDFTFTKRDLLYVAIAAAHTERLDVLHQVAARIASGGWPLGEILNTVAWALARQALTGLGPRVGHAMANVRASFADAAYRIALDARAELDAHPDEVEPHDELASTDTIALCHVACGRPADALKLLEGIDLRGLPAAPHALVLCTRAIAEARNGRTRRAKKLRSDVVRLDPSCDLLPVLDATLAAFR